jgi:V/A-type H+-transporting ATPase subunit D
MAVTYQFNKIAIQYLRKQLKARQVALPTLKSKESVLRAAVQKQKERLAELQAHHDAKTAELQDDIRMWGEFPFGIFLIKQIITQPVKVAGIPVPELKEIVWEIREFSKFNKPVWITTGIRLLKELATDVAQMDILKKDIEILDRARRKTTQKVNLYEKVQIPEFSDAILKIKRYLEDVENLEKAAQKITKQRMAQGGQP